MPSLMSDSSQHNQHCIVVFIAKGRWILLPDFHTDIFFIKLNLFSTCNCNWKLLGFFRTHVLACLDSIWLGPSVQQGFASPLKQGYSREGVSFTDDMLVFPSHSTVKEADYLSLVSCNDIMWVATHACLSGSSLVALVQWDIHATHLRWVVRILTRLGLTQCV